MDEYKPNSKLSKETTDRNLPEKKIDKVVSGTVQRKKKSGLQKFAGIFMPEDVGDIKSYIIMSVLIPAVKKMVSETVDMFLYGESKHTKRNDSLASKISYRGYYDKPAIDPREPAAYSVRAGYDYDDIVLSSRMEAEEVILRMDELISSYGIVSVADFYELVGVSGNYTDNNYGWTNIKSAVPIRTREGGYIIKMPKPLPLK